LPAIFGSILACRSSLVLTQRAGQEPELAADACAQAVRLIIACGGDGTISEVANGILQSAAKTPDLGIVRSS